VSVTTVDGERVELHGQMSLRELTLLLFGLTMEVSDDDGALYDVDAYAELTLHRDQVVALRDELSAWLARSEL
jgi:hypothetical protein